MKLSYFDIKARAQPIRYLLVDNGIPYEDELIPVWRNEDACEKFRKGEFNLDDINSGLFQPDFSKEWLEKKSKMPYGQVPALETDDGLKIAPTNAILRYLARKFKLCGSTDEQATEIDMLFEFESELRERMYSMIYSNFYNGSREKLSNIVMPRGLTILEGELKKNKGGVGFLVGDEITFVDYKVADLLDTCKAVDPKALDAFPALNGYFDRIIARPKIAELREKEPYKSMTFVGAKYI
ncbi:unnamed protein product [Owenia fusiformis]|uniref:glutathione transferase n=1 Tax=Owenia fusiformis TaxID=6347 RepID=A0A8S4NRZ6_OWEFU|nr:unnamed protein product [Owenia fusiformis]